MRINNRRRAFAWAAAALVAAAMLPVPAPVHVTAPSLVDLVGDNEIPNTILDGIFEIGSDVLAFLTRMSPL